MRLRLTLTAGLTVAILASILIYWPGVHGGFLLDDYANIVQNTALKPHSLSLADLMAAAFSSGSGPLDRPISMLSFALNEYFFGPLPYSMKVTNIFIHAVNGLLLYAVAALILTAYRRRFRPDLSQRLILGTALAIAAAWLLLPINLTAVLYIVQRMTSLSGTFVLAGVALYLWGRLRMLDGKAGFWLLWLAMIVCGGLGVLAKEIGALLPVYTVVVEWTLFSFTRASGERDRRLYLYYLIVLALPGILGLLWLWPSIQASAVHSIRPFTLTERLLTEPRVVLLYIAWSLAPNLGTLSLYHDDFPFSTGLFSPPTTFSAILGIIALIALAIWQRRQRPLLSLGILWFLCGQLMTATIFNLELVFEHRNYLPDFGLLLAVFGLALLEPPVERLRFARRILVIGLITLYAGILGLRVHQWANPIRFAIMSATEHPNSPRATYDLGRTYANLVTESDSSLLPDAIKSLEKAAAVPNASILPESALLILNAKIGKPLLAQWWRSIDRKLSSRPATPQDISALNAMVRCDLKECHFNNNKMIGAFRAALNKNPRNANIVTIYSNYTLNVLHNYALTQKTMHVAIDLAPKQPQYRINLIKLQIFLRQFDAARQSIEDMNVLNRFGHLDTVIATLKKRLSEAEKTRPNSPPPSLKVPKNPASKH
ncbi:MAG: hypothetical protein P8014_20420 [Acidihalobacter sp.]|uniref:hypothetical protein n=1 Tax=Acidihalobacter sp. TaxID=1872108 RepID=UPI00307D5EA4